MRRYETECDLRRWDFQSSALPTELPSQPIENEGFVTLNTTALHSPIAHCDLKLQAMAVCKSSLQIKRRLQSAARKPKSNVNTYRQTVFGGYFQIHHA